MRAYANEYNTKLVSAEKAVEAVQSGQNIFYGYFAMSPRALDEALAKRVGRGELSNITVNADCIMEMPKVILADTDHKSVLYHSGHFSAIERKLSDQGLCYFRPSNFGMTPSALVQGHMDQPQFMMVAVTSMDANGFFNFSTSTAFTKEICDCSNIVIVEVNDQAPVCLGAGGEGIHISQVDYIVEHSCPMYTVPTDIPPSEADKKIAQLVINELSDGACLQFGIGSLPNTIGQLIATSDLKDLGIHSEMMADCFIDLFERGIVNGVKKRLESLKMSYTFALGSRRLYDFIDNNPACLTMPVAISNNPSRIAMNDKQISINNAMEIDLFGQVSSESSGFRQISGTGGQLDFTIGALKSKGGKAMLCLSSGVVKKGQLHSRIVPYFKPGTIVSVPRSYVSYILTEHGIVNLTGKSTYQRAGLLIGIADPEFQDDLVKAANDMNIWTRTNKMT